MKSKQSPALQDDFHKPQASLLQIPSVDVQGQGQEQFTGTASRTLSCTLKLFCHPSRAQVASVKSPLLIPLLPWLLMVMIVHEAFNLHKRAPGEIKALQAGTAAAECNRTIQRWQLLSSLQRFECV